MKRLTLCEIGHIVRDNEAMHDEYCKRISEMEIKYSKGNNRIGNKKVGIRRLILSQQYIAQAVYRDFQNQLQTT
jgi:hypothetical protein